MKHSSAQTKENRKQRIAIVGAGLIGRLLAWRLLLRGHRVYLFEASSFASGASASYVAAGMIAPLSELVKTRIVVYEMGLASLQLWRAWLPALEADVSGAGALWFQDSGSIVVAHPADAAELRQFAGDLHARFAEAMPPSSATSTCTASASAALSAALQRPAIRHLSENQVRAMEPALSARFRDGLLLPDEACVDNRALLHALLSAARKLGGHCYDGVRACLCARRGLILDDANIGDVHDACEYDWVLDCRGTGAIGEVPGLRAVRGEVLRVHCDAVSLQHTVRIMHPRYQLYIAPRAGNRFVIGATEIESNDDSPLSVQSALELCGALYAVHASFAEARIEETSVGLRPAFEDNLPHVQRARDAENILHINGLYRYGFMVAPVIAEHVIGLLEGHRAAPCFADPLDKN